MSRINYNLKKIKAIVFDIDGVLSPSTVPMGSDGNPVRMVNIKDGYAMQLAVKKGLKIAIISGGVGQSLIMRFAKLGIRDIYLGASHKTDILEVWISNNALEPEEVAYVGDDIPDFKAMLMVGLKVAPHDAVWQIKEIADYISPVDGGYGVARDLLEQIMIAQGMWLDSHEAFGW